MFWRNFHYVKKFAVSFMRTDALQSGGMQLEAGLGYQLVLQFSFFFFQKPLKVKAGLVFQNRPQHFLPYNSSTAICHYTLRNQQVTRQVM